MFTLNDLVSQRDNLKGVKKKNPPSPPLQSKISNKEDIEREREREK